MQPTALLILGNFLKLPFAILVATLLIKGLDIAPQKQRTPNGPEVPVHPVDPGHVSFAQVVSYRPLRDVDEKLVEVKRAVLNWRLPSGTTLSPLMLEIGRCAAFKPNAGIKTCLYMKQWWLALIVAWSCVGLIVSCCGGICSSWIDGTVYVHQWHRPGIEALFWILSGSTISYSLASWKYNFSYNLKPGSNDQIYVYFKLPANWIISAMACFVIAAMAILEIFVVKCRGKPFTVDDEERDEDENENYRRRSSGRRRSSLFGYYEYGRRRSSATAPLTERRKSEGTSPKDSKRHSVVVIIDNNNGRTVVKNGYETYGDAM